MTIDSALPPSIWPSVDDLAEGRCKQLDLQAALASTEKALVVASELGDAGIAELEAAFSSNPELRAWLVVVLYPACLTRSEHLDRLLTISRDLDGRLTVVLFAKELDWSPSVNLILSYRHNLPPSLLIGPTPFLAISETSACHLNACLEVGDGIADEVRRWFDWLAGQSTPLTEGNTSLPHLVRPQGSPEGARAWRQFLDTLAGNLFSDGTGEVALDPKSSEVLIRNPDGEILASPSEAMELPRLDPLAEELTSILASGMLITIDRTSRSRPLDAPLSPRALGLEELREGAVTVKLTASASLFDAEAIRRLDEHRKKLSFLLDKFSFGLADGLKWMPDNAREMFDEEVAKSREAGENFLLKLVGRDPRSFVQSKRSNIERDVLAIYRRFRPEGRLPDQVVEKVLNDLGERLEGALAGMIPQINEQRPGIRMAGARPDDPAWGLALTFVVSAGLKLREAKGSFFGRGLDRGFDLQQWFKVMNVLSDQIEGVWNFRQIDAETAALRELRDGTGAQGDRCRQAMALIRGETK